MSEARRDSAVRRAIRAATKVEPHELQATVLSFLFVFTLMAAYFILRPVRDAMSSDWSDEELSWLWTSTFFFSVVAVFLYGAIISRVRFKRLVQPVRVSPSVHDTASLLIDDLDLVFYNHVLYVLFEKCIGLEQLVHRMNPFALDAKVAVELFLFFGFFLRAEVFPVNFANFDSHVGKNKEMIGIAT